MKILSDGELLSAGYEDILFGTPLFRGVTREDIAAMLICLRAEARAYDKGEYIRREGDPAGTIGVVLDGGVQIQQEDYYGTRTILRDAGPGQSFGEGYACAGVERLPVSVVCRVDSAVLFFRTERIFTVGNACEFHQILVENLLRIVAEKNVFMNNRLCSISHKTTREKLLAFLLDESRKNNADSFTIQMNRQELADYLGVERSAMSAELGRMRREGLIETDRNFFRLTRQKF